MSAAGTPSTDPWVILARERARYEEQFKSLKPNNGIITGDQAKGFFLQSQLPPFVLGQIWALADTDSDGKMDINEFSIACKLINLKLRGFEIPKGLPPSLLASLKVNTPPAIPPLPNPALISQHQPPARPDPPKATTINSAASIVNSVPAVPSQPTYIPSSQPLVGTAQPMLNSAQPLVGVGTLNNSQILNNAQPLAGPPARPAVPPIVPGLGGGIGTLSGGASVGPTGIVPPVSLVGGGSVSNASSIIPTGIVPPMQTNITAIPAVQAGMPLINSSIPPLSSVASIVPHNAVASAPSVVGSIAPAPHNPVPSFPPVVSQTLPSFGLQNSVIPSIPPSGISAPMAPLVTAVSSASVMSSGPLSPAGSIGSVGAPAPPLAGPGATSTPRASVTSLERTASIDSVSGPEWAVPHHIKLKYTQMFNTMDRTRSGYLSGAQARNVMVQTKLPQQILAVIWALSDMDADGRLGCEEFVLAMYLCEQAATGHPPPAKLPPELVPPSFRRTTRTASISSQGSAVHADQDPASTLPQTSFEDKRKENYEKGQAELERRRKTLMDQQRKEAEERERKEREELERKERARQEAERKRMEELEKMMREQQEKERLVEEERKRQAEQREAARKEMERQRQLEWEKQRLHELQQQRQREQENVLKLKAKNQSLTIELSSLNDQIKDLSQKICDTRIGVSNVKTTIDGMRNTRDTSMHEMSQLKSKLKDQNARLLALSQEKAKLEAKNKINTQDSEQAKVAFDNKEVIIKNLKEKVADVQEQVDSKLNEFDNNSSQLEELKTQMKNLISECETLYSNYEQKRDKILEMKNASKTIDYGEDAWKATDAWGATTNSATSWPVDNQWGDSAVPPDIENIPGVHKYRAIYEFSARNNDEISFQPGDIIHVPEQQTGEPGWLAGEIRGHTGWFPESYVEPVDGIGIQGAIGATTQVKQEPLVEPTKLEGISEVQEPPLESSLNSVNSVTNQTVVNSEVKLEGEPEQYIANYPYQSQEPGDLTFNAGDVIAVYKKEGDWWTGKLNENVGIFPSNYVQKVDNAASSVTNSAAAAPAPAPASATATATAITNDAGAVSTGVSAAAVTSALENISNANAQVDNEVSQINENKPPVDRSFDRSTDVSATPSSQVMKGKKPEIASVIAPYQATGSEQLSLARGQLIMIRKKTDSGWWEGELQAKGRKRQVGWFPASYVKILNSTGRISGRTTPVSTTRMQQEIIIDKVVALYPYTANNPDELSFLKDDIINVTAREEEAWWRGELNGVSGLFPSNYVAPLQQNP